MRIPTSKREAVLYRDGIVPVGCDEVGRGCLAGPVVAAAVVLPEELPRGWRNVLRDSKALSRAQRVEADAWIRQHAVAFGIGEVDVATIDTVNILQASLMAMRRALAGVEAGHVLVDGNFTIPGVDMPQTTIVGGDARCASIAAASIIAKEYRDQLMERLHVDVPAYGFAQHKGYGTAQHYAAIAEYGLTPHHRKTFCRKIKNP